MSSNCFTLFYSYTQIYNNYVSQSIYLRKLAVLPFLNVKSLVYLNKSCTNRFYRWGYGLKENESHFYFCRITIPAFPTGELKGRINYRIAFTGLTDPYPLLKKSCFKSKANYIYREPKHKLFDYMRAWIQLSNTINITSGR